MTKVEAKASIVRRIRKLIRRYKSQGEARLRVFAIRAAHLESRKLGDALSKRFAEQNGA